LKINLLLLSKQALSCTVKGRQGAVMLQWKGLPYGECTFETPEAISEAGGQDQLDQYEVSTRLHAFGIQ
jgi:hypothetical protein